MSEPDPEAVLIERISALTADRSAPLLVALDGRSGAGKSTLARSVAATLGGVVIEGDDFYAGGTAEQWDAMDAAERVVHVIDWRRQRPVLEALAAGRPATWMPYDWHADDGRLGPEPLHGEPAAVVILDGAYSARPELADLLDLRVLLDTPRVERRRRLLARESERYRAEWEARWTVAEELYFGEIMPPAAFDLVLTST